MAEAASITGTIQSLTTSEADIRAGGRTLIITLTDVFWASAVGFSNAVTQAIIDGLDSNHSESLGWDAIVKAGLVFGDLTRTTDQVVTIVLPAFATFNIQVDEIITITVPDVAYNTFQEIGGAGGDPGDPGGEGENVHQIGDIVITTLTALLELAAEIEALTLQIEDIVITAPVAKVEIASTPLAHTFDIGDLVLSEVNNPEDEWFTSTQGDPGTFVKFIHAYGLVPGSGFVSVIPKTVTSCFLAEEGDRVHAGGPFNPQGTGVAFLGPGAEDGTGELIPLAVVADHTDIVVIRINRLFPADPLPINSSIVAPSVGHS